MSNIVGQMTKDEFAELIESIVERKLVELLSDPDHGLELHDDVRTRLQQQRQDVAAGDRGRGLDDVVRDLPME